jgi:hypothetical protein
MRSRSFFFGIFLMSITVILFNSCGTKNNNPTTPLPATDTPTFSITPTASFSSTPTDSATPTKTATVTYTSTLTNTPTNTFTPTATSTVDAFTTESFEEASIPTGWESWHVGSTATALALSTGEAYDGSKSAYTQVVFTASGQLGQIQVLFNPVLNLTGKTVTFWYYVDNLPSASGSTVGVYVNSNSGDGGTGNLAITTGAWTKITCPISVAASPSAIYEVGIVISSGSTGPFNTVNFYVDDVSIQ